MRRGLCACVFEIQHGGGECVSLKTYMTKEHQGSPSDLRGRLRPPDAKRPSDTPSLPWLHHASFVFLSPRRNALIHGTLSAISCDTIGSKASSTIDGPRHAILVESTCRVSDERVSLSNPSHWYAQRYLCIRSTAHMALIPPRRRHSFASLTLQPASAPSLILMYSTAMLWAMRRYGGFGASKPTGEREERRLYTPGGRTTQPENQMSNFGDIVAAAVLRLWGRCGC